jgi:hypothetical protein
MARGSHLSLLFGHLSEVLAMKLVVGTFLTPDGVMQEGRDLAKR